MGIGMGDMANIMNALRTVVMSEYVLYSVIALSMQLTGNTQQWHKKYRKITEHWT